MVHVLTGTTKWFMYRRGQPSGSCTDGDNQVVHVLTGTTNWFMYRRGQPSGSCTDGDNQVVHVPTGTTKWFMYRRGQPSGSCTDGDNQLVHVPTCLVRTLVMIHRENRTPEHVRSCVHLPQPHVCRHAPDCHHFPSICC